MTRVYTETKHQRNQPKKTTMSTSSIPSLTLPLPHLLLLFVRHTIPLFRTPFLVARGIGLIRTRGIGLLSYPTVRGSLQRKEQSPTLSRSLECMKTRGTAYCRFDRLLGVERVSLGAKAAGSGGRALLEVTAESGSQEGAEDEVGTPKYSISFVSRVMHAGRRSTYLKMGRESHSRKTNLKVK